MRAKSGFTLVEILIVVVILGILAAIVIPQFTEASTEAKTSSLCTDLQTMRSQIELYKIQHSDALPSAASVGLVSAMTSQTDADGDAYTTSSTTGPFGPYVQKIPTNAFNGSDGINPGTADPNAIPIDSDGTYGWYFNTSSGAFNACDSTDHADL
jgi:general secretion pathway protein G